MPNRPGFRFPKHFLWGAATSAHQVEGGLHNQWSVWELENAKVLAAQAAYQYDDLDNWRSIKRSAESPANYVSGNATKHYDLYEHDIELVEKMNMNAFRFSIEWSSIQPEPGFWNDGEVAHYRAVLAALKKRHIEPIVTLFHFTVPVWFAEIGGFERRANLKYFVEFAERIIRELGDSVTYIITLNEPEVYATQSYYLGKWPPQQQSVFKLRTVLNNLAVAHVRVAKRLHALDSRFQVSVAKDSAFIYPGDDSWLSIRAAALSQYFQDDYFLRKVMRHCDFIGVNYYFSDRVYGYRIHNDESEVNDLGWSMHPQHLEQVLERLADKYKKPIFITENGVADADDKYRKWWLAQSMAAMQRAIMKGVEVIGYLHWSLTDNFEWDKGFWPRFGLFEVDYHTYRRTPRPSAVWFARFLKKARE